MPVAAEARDDVRAVLLLLEKTGLEPGAQVLGDELGGGALVARVVDRDSPSGRESDPAGARRSDRLHAVQSIGSMVRRAG